MDAGMLQIAKGRLQVRTIHASLALAYDAAADPPAAPARPADHAAALPSPAMRPELREQHRLGERHFRKETVSRLLKVMDNLEAIVAWRLTLNEKQRVEWASPDTIVRRCPIFNKPQAEAKPSPYAKLAQANAELQIELHDLKQRAAHGDPFDLKNDRVETIAGTIIDMVGIDKAVKIAHAILNSPQHQERERAERELAEGSEE